MNIEFSEEEMDNLKYEIQGYYELLNLHKALLEAKFHQNPDNKNVAGSPFISKFCNEIADLLQEYDYAQKGKDTWGEWRQLSNQEHYINIAVEKIIEAGKWKTLDKVSKRDTVLNYISPFQGSERELEDLIGQIDKLAINEEAEKVR